VHFLPLGAAFSLILSGLARGQTEGKDFRHYYNPRWSFCIGYPDGWDHDEGLNKAGIRIAKPADAPVVFITVGALPNQPRGFLTGDYDDMTPMTVEENVQRYMRGLNSNPVSPKYGRGSNREALRGRCGERWNHDEGSAR
jgi:hypothetical protein